MNVVIHLLIHTVEFNVTCDEIHMENRQKGIDLRL